MDYEVTKELERFFHTRRPGDDHSDQAFEEWRAKSAAKGYELADYQPGQWWLEELENISTRNPLTPEQYRAVAVVLRFFRMYFEDRDNGTS